METIVNTFLLAYSAFIPVLNPFGGSMFLLALTPGVDDASRAAMVRRIVFYSAIILFASLFAGHLILSFFGISMGVLRICGGIVLFYAGWSALNAPAESTNDDAKEKSRRPLTRERLMSMAFYPITLPITMGPGCISVATAMGAGIFESGLEAFIGLTAACLATLATVFVCYRYCDRVSRAVGAAGADAISRIFAFILICIGTGVFWQGLAEQIRSMPVA